ncbi:MAG: pyridoxamine 5'-phosphate oxidase family protein [Candidatus Latescibacteria bacterium]|nr:pyridoxamine 5'-phosphate oxidase family protein [Candidatus Latescibacterota bacterium]
MNDSIETREALRALYGEPSELVRRKRLDRLDRHCRALIAHSPFVVVASADAGGRADASPRGGDPGFVSVSDDRTVVIPDWPGNRLIDTMENIIANPRVGLLFLVPGVNETLRLNGGATISTNGALLESLAVGGKRPRSALVVEVEEAFLHCSKSLMRAALWHPESQIPRQRFPSLGQMLADQIAEVDAEAAEDLVQTSIAKGLYKG